MFVLPKKVAEYQDDAGEYGEKGHGEGDDAHYRQRVKLCHGSWQVTPHFCHIPFSAAVESHGSAGASQHFLWWLMENWYPSDYTNNYPALFIGSVMKLRPDPLNFGLLDVLDIYISFAMFDTF